MTPFLNLGGSLLNPGEAAPAGAPHVFTIAMRDRGRRKASAARGRSAFTLRGRAALAAGAMVAALVSPAQADKQPVAEIVREQLASWVPAGLGVATVHVPASLAKGTYETEQVTVEVPRELRAGRPSVKVSVRGKSAVFVPVTIAKLVDVAVATHAITEGSVIGAADITIEQRAVTTPGNLAPSASLIGSTATHAIAAGAAVVTTDVALPPPLARGTQVQIELHRGSVVVRGTATLEAPTRPGAPATARLAQTKTLVRGTLVAPATVVVPSL